ncbi:MAG TPA: T9SS type A sorting domain-containing protein [Bacteroidales bacterium]|jgi:hypothetical protein|nr:T9SS type A sorting domain-containing protein [Bacteroidales bacterium]
MTKSLVIVLSCSLIAITINAQVWQQTYGVPGSFEIARGTIKHYDNGFIMAVDRNDRFVWMVKADINGNIKWSNTYSETDNNIMTVFSVASNQDGSTFLTGGTNTSVVNTFIIRTDECGTYKWCKRINQYDDNFAYSIKSLADGNLSLLTYGASENYLIDRFQIWEIDPDGNILWVKQIIPGTQYLFQDTQFFQMCLTSDGGSLLAGYAYYPYDTTNNPYDAVLQPCLVKCDSLGEMQWVYPPLSGADTTKIGFFAGCAQIGNTYYAVGSHYDTTEFFLRPLVARFDLNGNLQSYICSEPDTMYHSLSQVLPVSDTSILLISAANNIFTDPNYLMVFLSDTMGHFTKAFTRTDLVVGQYGDEVAKLRDNKFVIACQYPIGWPGANTDVVAIKLNANLEYDSIYTQAYTYDSLCPYPIVSDTVICNCEPFVSIYEAQSVTKTLNIYPNPASDHFVINCGQEKPAGGALLIYDVYGRLKYLEEQPPGKSQSVINCEHWKPGLYFARWESGGKAVGVKVIVK